MAGQVELVPAAPACRHPPARVFAEPVIRDMLRALGIETCGRCFAVIRVHARGQVYVRESRGA